MSRAEKRRQYREQNKNATYRLNQNQIQQLKEQSTMDATERAFVILLGFSMMSLRDEFGFGEKRLNQFLNKLFQIYEAYQDKYISLNDLHDVIKQETGIDVRDKLHD